MKRNLCNHFSDDEGAGGPLLLIRRPFRQRRFRPEHRQPDAPPDARQPQQERHERAKNAFHFALPLTKSATTVSLSWLNRFIFSKVARWPAVGTVLFGQPIA
jgi:hypothetical protein